MRNGLQAIMLGSALLLCAVPLSAQAQTKSPAKVTAGMSWVNEFGAVLKVTAVGSGGLLSGTYTTNVGCGAGKAQPMTGWYYPGEAGGAITFSVSWTGCNSGDRVDRPVRQCDQPIPGALVSISRLGADLEWRCGRQQLFCAAAVARKVTARNRSSGAADFPAR